jgi:hypothetical protein
MSASLSTYARAALINALCKNTSFQGAATLYLSFHTGAPGLVGSNESWARSTPRLAHTSNCL